MLYIILLYQQYLLNVSLEGEGGLHLKQISCAGFKKNKISLKFIKNGYIFKKNIKLQYI